MARKFLIMLQNLQQMRLKRLQKAEATSNLIGNRIVNSITRVSKSSQRNNSETVTNKHDKEIPKEKYISTNERQEIVDKLRLK